VLADAGLLRLGPAQGEYLIGPAGRTRFFEEIGEPVQRAEQQLRRLLDGDAFRRMYPLAYARWCEAEKLLHSAESDREFTTIGHKAREAMQEFATELVERYQPDDVDRNRAHVNVRVGAVLAQRGAELGDARASLLRALGDYSEAVLAIVQRQVHGGQEERHELTWHDARRVVLQLGVLLAEFAPTLPPPRE
jgi:hypothetical protein